ncbi:hydroxymethylpyrimidine ABC transporter, ATPase component [Desulfocucumis palustris]|uniref:Hydroxymethylpyrimidine ABC transporter, ATPase component n=1 Tax=Desulfocucumis palustris TaxID=1898651 RepID=A0A2L2XEB7_9FIRM|nr:ABC transporter ATP-binding protein [Desulfocucumis palustris]GBF34053.1 hydroxymethylpyrimidine ABC transporter, ATPase component [Desulfocucumis palustris]
MAILELVNLTKYYEVNGNRLPVLDGISASLGEGEFVGLIGPSGCGKSTLFNIICGLVKPDGGTLLLDGREGGSPRDVVSYMPQKDLLFPWRSVLDNVVLAREVAGENREAAKREARSLMPLFGLEGFENSFPAQLSGGMRQRAAMMRTALARRPVWLLDEPFGALDAITRKRMQRWILEVWERFKQTVFLVTHDIEEALFLSDRVYVLTPRPARVALHLEVGLSRPRSAGTMTEPEFLKLKKRLMEVLE